MQAECRIPMEPQANRKPYLILGMGVTGRSVAQWMVGCGMDFDMADSRSALPDAEELQQSFPQASLFLGECQEIQAEKYQSVVISPGVPHDMPLVQRLQRQGLQLTGDIDLFAAVATAPVTAVTGSNGKSTVVDMLAAMYQQAGKKAALGGNFGIPALDLLEREETERFILELSSFQLDTAEIFRADVAALLNVSEDHMDRYASFEAYAQSKGRIYRDARVGVVNREDRWSAELGKQSASQVTFGQDVPTEGQYGLIQTDAETWLCRGSEKVLPVSALRVLGRHNWVNALAALALGEADGLPMVAMLDALRNYTGLPHRTEWVAEINGVTWINDSKATNVGAVVAALKGIDRQVILLAGGQGKDADFTPLQPAVKRYVRHAFVYGEDRQLLADTLAGHTQVSIVSDLESAVSAAADVAQQGDCVLLSPACSSFDQFPAYTVRGERFRQLVGEVTQ